MAERRRKPTPSEASGRVTELDAVARSFLAPRVVSAAALAALERHAPGNEIALRDAAEAYLAEIAHDEMRILEEVVEAAFDAGGVTSEQRYTMRCAIADGCRRLAAGPR